MSDISVSNQNFSQLTEAVFSAARATQLVKIDTNDDDKWAKADKTPVTVADLASQAIILKCLASIVPGETIFAEEDTEHLEDDYKCSRVIEIVEEVTGKPVSRGELSNWIGYRGDPDGSTCWFVDPLDGTKGFVKGLLYAVGVARSVDGVLERSWLAVPCREDIMPGVAGQIFWAVRGEGAFQQRLDKETDPVRLQLPGNYSNDELTIVGSRAHGDSGGPKALEESGLKINYLPFDSQAKYAGVATNTAQVYQRPPHPKFGPNFCWDHAPGALLVEEAGGVVTDLTGRPLDYTHGTRLNKNSGILAAINTDTHKRSLELFKKD